MDAWPTFVTIPVPICESALQPPDSYKPTMSPVAKCTSDVGLSELLHISHVKTLQIFTQIFGLTGSEAVARQGQEAEVLSRLKDDDCATVQARGLTSYVQLEQANTFILKILERDVLLPNPTCAE